MIHASMYISYICINACMYTRDIPGQSYICPTHLSACIFISIRFDT